jgi:hypothetical protein
MPGMAKPASDVKEILQREPKVAEPVTIAPHVEVIARNAAGQFKVGHTGIGGRPRGSRSVLSTLYCDALLASWQKHGENALEACATLDPVAYVRAIGQLLPRDVNVDTTIDLRVSAGMDALTAFRTLRALPAPELRRLKDQIDDGEAG